MPFRRRHGLAPIAACLPLVASCVPAVQDSRPALAAGAVRLQYEVVAGAPHLPLSLASGPARTAAPAPVATPFQPASLDRAQIARATDCLTAAIYYEARSEGEAGQRAVAQVVLNRVRHRAYPATVCGVVYQHAPGQTCQFSFSCDGSMRARREPYAWAEARRIAEEALAGSVYAPVGLSTHYHTQAVSPGWGRRLARVTVIGAHIFYGGRDPYSARSAAAGAEAARPSPEPRRLLWPSVPTRRAAPASQPVRAAAAPAGAPARRQPLPQPGFAFSDEEAFAAAERAPMPPLPSSTGSDAGLLQ